MFVWDLILAVIIGVVLTAVFAFGFRRRGPWLSVLLFFLLVFFGTWAAAIWVGPVGPAFYGVFWLPPLMVGLAIALLLAAAFPAVPRRTPREEIELERKTQPVSFNFSGFFVVLLVLLVVLILVGYLI
jgi:ABC-type nickel/cobalt efflux system permease component RcnA